MRIFYLIKDASPAQIAASVQKENAVDYAGYLCLSPATVEATENEFASLESLDVETVREFGLSELTDLEYFLKAKTYGKFHLIDSERYDSGIWQAALNTATMVFAMKKGLITHPELMEYEALTRDAQQALRQGYWVTAMTETQVAINNNPNPKYTDLLNGMFQVIATYVSAYY